jgi:poly(A) polymerase/tRNA nucleotidyltransferase (CCA-adding enzyme)
MRYWGFDKDLIQKVSHLVLHHMFDADPRLTDKSVRRLIRKVGKDLIYDLLKVRIADRLGTPNRISMKKIKLLKKKIDKEIVDIV